MAVCVYGLVTVKFAILKNARALHGGMWHYGVINTIKEHCQVCHF